MQIVTVGARKPSQGDQGVLDRVLVRGLAWTGGIKWISQILSWISTVIVARILTPEDYGLFGMAAVYLTLVTLVNEFGLGASVVANRNLTDGQIAQVNTVSVQLGLIAFLLSWGAAGPLAWFFKAPDLEAVVIVMSVTFLISSIRVVPSSLLERELRFKTLALVEGFQAMTQAICMILVAFLGFRYWALVFGGVIASAAGTAGVLCARRHGFAWPRLQSIKPALVFSWRILVARLTWYVYYNAPFVLVGRMLGQAALGVFTIVWTIAEMPLEKITGLVGRVAFPLFAQLQHDEAALRRYLLSMTEGIAIVTFPIAIGLALVADEFIPLVLGAKWSEAVVPLSILAALAALRSIVPLIPQVMNLTGGLRFGMYNGVATAIGGPIAFYMGCRWGGVIGVAFAWWAVQLLTACPVYWWVFRRIHISARDYMRALWPAVSGTTVMAFVVLVLRQGAIVDTLSWWQFGLHVVAGGLAYVLATVTMHRNRVQAFWAIVRARGEFSAQPC